MSLFKNITDFWLLLSNDSIGLIQALKAYPSVLWLAGAVLALIAVVILLITHSRRSRRRRGKDELIYPRAKGQKPARIFVPVEKTLVGPDTVLLPLTERIVACGEQISREVAKRIVLDAPGSLTSVTAAYPRCSEGLQSDLMLLVRETHMMEDYGRCICEEGLPTGILADAWSWFSDTGVLRGYVELLASRDEQMQMNAVRLLSALQDTRCLPMLVSALSQPERYVSSRVAEVFVSMPEKSASMLVYMLPDIDDKHKVRVLETIAQTNCSFAPKNVVACLRHSDPEVRAAAVLALGASRMTECVPQLMMSAADKRWQVRAAAAKAMGMIGDSRCLSILHGLAGDSEGWVGAAANEALQLFENA